MNIFDIIINELTSEDNGTEQLDQCMKFNHKLSRKVPLRYKIISVGFVRKYSVEEVNAKLQEYGLAKLYARNLWEASLLFAFSNKLTYEEWRELSMTVQSIRESVKIKDDVFGESKFSMNTLKEYLDINSDTEKEELLTQHKTKHIENAIAGIHASEAFIKYIQSSIHQFSRVREKTRYYFCKYLYYYLDRKIEEYLKASSKGIEYRPEEIMDELSIFKGASTVKRSVMAKEEIRDVLENANLSCGVLYAEFNEFFFDYVSLDWMNVLMDQVGSIDNLPPNKVEKLVNAARHYDKSYKEKSDNVIINDLKRKLEEQDEEQDEAAALNAPNRGYQKNRMGENTVRKYIKGELDLDRTTFICFLLFLGSELTKPARLFIETERLDQMLVESGFMKLDEYNDFDYFVINFLRTEDPVDYLMEEVTRYALSEENFYLYKLYLASRSDDTDIGNLMKET